MRPSRLHACLLLLASALLALPAVAGKAVAEPLSRVRTLQVEGVVVIDIDGKVSDYRLETSLGDALQGAVGRAVRSWRFHPVVIDGQARRAESAMRITLAAVPVGEQFEVRVDNVVFPNPEPVAEQAAPPRPDRVPQRIERGSMPPPSYPDGLAWAGVSGRVLVAIRVGEDGSAAEVAAVQSMLLDVRGRDRMLQQATGLFERSALSAAKQWTFRLPPDFSAWPPEKRVLTVSVEYVMQGTPDYYKPGVWRTVVRTPKRDIGWMPLKPGTQSAGVADVAPGEFLPVASTLSLASDVVGRAL